MNFCVNMQVAGQGSRPLELCDRFLPSCCYGFHLFVGAIGDDRLHEDLAPIQQEGQVGRGRGYRESGKSRLHFAHRIILRPVSRAS